MVKNLNFQTSPEIKNTLINLGSTNAREIGDVEESDGFKEGENLKRHISIVERRQILEENLGLIQKGDSANICQEILKISQRNVVIDEIKDDDIINSFEKKISVIEWDKSLQNIASGEESLMLVKYNIQMHLLNYFAYFQNYKFLSVLFLWFEQKKKRISLLKDDFGSSLIEIGLLLRDRQLLNLLIKELTKNPPEFEKCGELSERTISSLINLGVQDLTNFLDSRLFYLRDEGNNIFFRSSNENESVGRTIRIDPSESKLSISLLKQLRIKSASVVNGDFSFDKTDTGTAVVYVSDIIGLGQTFKKNEKKKGKQQSITEDKHVCIFDAILNKYDDKHEIFVNKTIVAITNKKWNEYGRKNFVKEIIYGVFLIIVCARVAGILDFLEREEWISPGLIFLFILGYFVVIFELLKEVLEFNRLSQYFENPKNFLDLFFILSLLFHVATYSYLTNARCNMAKCPVEFQWLGIARSINNLSLSLKWIWYFQISVTLGFLLRIVLYAIKQSLFFFLCFVLLVIFMVITVTGLKISLETVNTESKLFGVWIRHYFFYTYKLALGDFGDFFLLNEGEDYYSPKNWAIFAYFLFFSTILTIILLNLLISVLGKSFTEIKSKEMNVTYAATILVLNEVDQNYTVVTDEAYCKIDKPNYLHKAFFFLKFIIYFYFRRRVLLTTRTLGKYFAFLYYPNFSEFQEILADSTCKQVRTDKLTIGSH